MRSSAAAPAISGGEVSEPIATTGSAIAVARNSSVQVGTRNTAASADAAKSPATISAQKAKIQPYQLGSASGSWSRSA